VTSRSGAEGAVIGMRAAKAQDISDRGFHSGFSGDSRLDDLT
jgi:hypothetical protein